MTENPYKSPDQAAPDAQPSQRASRDAQDKRLDNRTAVRFLGAVALTIGCFLGYAGVHTPQAAAAPPSVTGCRVMTFNIAGTDKDWPARKPICLELLKETRPDAIGFQELLPQNLSVLLSELPEYGWFGPTIEDRDQTAADEIAPEGVEGESCRILYRKDRWDLDAESSGAFWYTDSEGKDAERYCVYARLISKQTGRAFYLYNTHWESGRGEENSALRSASADMILDQIRKRKHGSDFFVITGDFNTRLQSPSLKKITHGDRRTGIPIDVIHANRIDFIFGSKGRFEVCSAQVIKRKKDGVAASDHAQVMADLLYQ